MKILIVGCGSIGCRHAKNFQIQSSTEVVLFDKHIESAIDLADALEAMVVSNLCRATNKVRTSVNQDDNAGVVARKEGVARLER